MTQRKENTEIWFASKHFQLYNTYKKLIFPISIANDYFPMKIGSGKQNPRPLTLYAKNDDKVRSQSESFKKPFTDTHFYELRWNLFSGTVPANISGEASESQRQSTTLSGAIYIKRRVTCIALMIKKYHELYGWLKRWKINMSWRVKRRVSVTSQFQ